MQQLVERQLAAPIRQADDDAIHVMACDDVRQIGRRPQYERVAGMLAPRRVVDEPDDAVREVVLGENLRGHRARERTGADDEDVPFKPRVVREAVERQPPQRHGDKEQAE